MAYRRDKLKGCGKHTKRYDNPESNYTQGCDGWALCDGSYRLCEECMDKPLKDLLIER